MPLFKVKVSEKSFYEVEVDAISKEVAEDRLASFDIDYTKGRECSNDPEFKHLEKFWVESIEEVKR